MKNKRILHSFIPIVKTFMNAGKALTVMGIIACLILFANFSSAKTEASENLGKVMVWTTNWNSLGQDVVPYFNAIGKFYQDNNASVTVKQTGHLLTGSLDGVSLLWVFLPYENFTDADITYMSEFLETGGRIVFNGEHVGYFEQGNINISNAVQKLGGTFTVLAQNADNPMNGVISGACINRESKLTNGLTGYYLSASAKISYSGSTQVVIMDNSRAPIVVDQAVGKGRITLFTDVNNWDHVMYKSTASNNQELFLNLLTDARVNQGIVEEGGDPNSGFGGSPSYTISAPAASFAPASTESYSFQVEYQVSGTSNAIFTNAQFDDNDVTVKNASGTAYVVRKDTSVGGGTGIVSGAGTNRVVVQYTVKAPDGKWDLADKGIYTIGIVNGAVMDSNGKQVAGKLNAATFFVTVSESEIIKGVTLNGTAQVGEILSAVVDPVNASVHYQWKVDGESVGSDKATYTVQEADLGKTVTVTVTGTGIYTGEVTSTATNAVIAGKTPITSVGITSEAEIEIGQVLTAAVEPAAASANYQWKADGINVGTNSSTYTVQASDLNKTITVTATGTGDYKGKVTSPATGVVHLARTQVTGVSINGMAMLGQTLTASVTPAGSTVSYQWKADDTNVGTNTASYVIQNSDLGKAITLTVTGTGNYKGTVTSTATSAVTAAITIRYNNGTEIGGSSLSGALTGAMNTSLFYLINKLEITAGIVTTNDWNYIRNLTSLKELKVADAVTSVADLPDYSGNFIFPLTIKSVDIPKVASLGNYAFYNCTNLTTATFPDATRIGQNAFYNCTALTSAAFSDVTEIGQNAFYYCTTLTTAVFPKVTSIGQNAFYNCPNLATLKLSGNVPVSSTNFYGCPALRNLVFIDHNGNDLTGAELAAAQNAYKAASDGNSSDSLWYGWRVIPQTPIVSAVISGTAQVGEVLTATVQPEGATVTYQWKVNGYNVGTNSATYTPQFYELGSIITVTVTGTGDYSGTVTSEATSAVIAAKTPLTYTGINGSAQVGEVLTATVYPNEATVTYQWKADGINIGENTATYTVLPADFGKRITVTVTGTGNYKGTVTSQSTSMVIAGKTLLTSVAISGNPRIGEQLTATVTPSGAAVTYQWKANGINVGANYATYTVQPADLGKTITVTATGTGNYKGEVTSAATDEVLAARIQLSYVSINGIAQVGELLTAAIQPSGATVDYQWKANGINVGTNQATYTPQVADLGKTITVTVTGTDNYKGTITSQITNPVKAAKTSIASVSISGNAQVGELLTATVNPGGVTVDYQWKADGTNVGANTATYTVQTADLGKTITVTVTGTGNYKGEVTSAATDKILAARTQLSSVSISGIAQVGEPLTVAIQPSGAAVDYQWKANGINVGTNQATYTPQATDLGKTITVTVTGTGNYKGTVTSPSTSTVIAAKTSITSVAISGYPQVGELLTATVIPVSTTVTYQWKANGILVGGNSATYTVQPADLGKTITVTATGTGNYKGVLTSNATDAVIAAKTPISAVSVSGSALVGELLTAVVTPGGATATYQWKADDTPVGANSNTYMVQAADLGKRITVTATGTGNYSGSVTSTATTKVIDKTPSEPQVYTVTGTILDTENHSVPTATVILTDTTDPNKTYYGTTDANGNYSIPGVPNGTYTITVRKNNEILGTGNITVNGSDISGGGANLIVTPATPEQPGTPTYSLSGTITDTNATSVSGAAIVLRDVTDPTKTYYTTTDENGNYIIPGVPNGTYSITVIKNNETLGTGSITVNGSDISGGGANLIVTPATPGQPGTPTYTLSGRITDTNATSVSGAAIILRDTTDPTKTYYGTTDENGNYTIPGVPNGAYSITVIKNNETLGTGSVTVNGSDISGGGTDLIVTPATPEQPGTPTYTLSGRITDTNATSVSGAAIILRDTTDPTKTYYGTTDENGNYSIPGIPNGTYTIIVTKNNETLGTGSIAVNGSDISGGGTDVVVTPTTPAQPETSIHTISGRILDLYGNPVSGATVVLTDSSDPTKNYYGTTDVNGNYRITGISDGAYKITVLKNGQTLGTGNLPVKGADITGGSTDLTITTPEQASPSTPASSPSTVTEKITVDVKQGNSDKTLSNITIERVTDQKGNKSDTVTFMEDKAEEIVKKLKETGNDTARILIPESKDTIAETTIQLPSKTLDTIAKGGINLLIDTEKAKIDIPNQTLQNASDNMKDKMYFHLIPVKENELKQEITQRALFNIGILKGNEATQNKIDLISEPLTIETNMPSSAVDITLPLSGFDIPVDPKERAAYLNQLAVYIEHNDGDKEIVKGEIVNYKDGLLGIRFHIEKFSIFTIIKSEAFIKSSECDVIKIKAPATATIRGSKINATVASNVSDLTLKALVSEKANWELFHDKACTKLLTDHKVKLKTGENKVYLKVTAEDGSVKIYTMSIVRNKSTAAKIIKLNFSKKAVIKGTNITLTVAKNIKQISVDVNVSSKATWKLYLDKACKKELTDKKMQLNVGINTAYLKVIAENGTSNLYQVKATRETTPVVQSNTHVKLGVIGSSSYAKEVANIFSKDYNCDHVVIKREGNYYRVYMDFSSKAAAKAACEDMTARRYIMNYFYISK